MKSLPLFYYPTTLLIVDDDKFLLMAIEDVFNEKMKTLSFASSLDCINYLSNYKEPIYHQKLLQSLTEDDEFESLQHSPVDFDVTSLSTIADNYSRHDEISTMIVDFGIPDMNGLELAKKVRKHQIPTILLTGKALESDAIEGFNNSLIDRFVQKGKEDTEDKILQYTKELILNYFIKLSLPLLSHLETDSRLPQSDQVFITFFNELCDDRNIVEYYLIDKNGSYLCIDNAGRRFFLVIHSDRSINNWINLNKEENELSEIQKNDINDRRKIPFFGINKEAWQIDKNEWHRYLYTAFNLKGGREIYYWTIVHII